MKSEKRIFVSLDVAKYFMALMILLGHTSNEWAHVTGIWHYILSCDFAVPAFFAISGFLFFYKIEQLATQRDRNQYYKKWSIRIGKMYLVWSLIYLSFVIAGWCINGICLEKILKSVRRWIVFSTYATIWFLPALWIGGTIIYILYSHCRRIVMFSVALMLWMIGIVFGLYYGLFDSETLSKINDVYIGWFITFRNGIFYGSAYFLVGYCCLKCMNRYSFKKSTIVFCIFYLLFFVEAIFMHKYVKSPNTDMAILMLPSVFYMVIALAKLNMGQRPIYIALRNQSMLIFCGQRLFLSAIPGLLPTVFNPIRDFQSLSIMFLFCMPVILFAYTIDKLSYKYHFLTYLR